MESLPKPLKTMLEAIRDLATNALNQIAKSQGRTIWIIDAHRDDGRRFIVRSDEIAVSALLGDNND